jgi:ABC-type nitrate/sulfonate/bicarbonate transport system permease component
MSVLSIPTGRPRRKVKLLNRLAWLLVPAAPFLIVLAVWALAGEIFKPSRQTLPPIGDVVAAI